jgi:hypothetical protein
VPAIGRTHDGDGGDATPVRDTFETLECTCRHGEADYLVVIAIEASERLRVCPSRLDSGVGVAES